MKTVINYFSETNWQLISVQNSDPNNQEITHENAIKKV